MTFYAQSFPTSFMRQIGGSNAFLPRTFFAAAFQGELLSSLLEMILSVPYDLIQLNLSTLSSIVELALDMGLSGVSPASTWALDALENWTLRITEDRLEEFFRNSCILEKLASFLDVDQRSVVAKRAQSASGTFKDRQKNRLQIIDQFKAGPR